MASNLFLKHKVKHVYFYALILLIPYLLVPFIGQVPALILMNIIFIIVYKTRGNSWIRTLASYLLPITITNFVQSLISLTPLLNIDNPGVNLSLVLPVFISFSFAYLFMKVLIYCYQKYKHKIEGLYKNIYFKVAISFFIVGIIFLEIYGNVVIKKHLQLEQYLPPALIFFYIPDLVNFGHVIHCLCWHPCCKEKGKREVVPRTRGPHKPLRRSS